MSTGRGRSGAGESRVERQLPHAKHAGPQLGRGAGERDCREVAGEKHCGRGGAEFEGGDEARGVTGRGH